MVDSVRRALRLLDRRSRRVFYLLIAVQAALAFLDLAGVLLIGLVAALGTAGVTGQSSSMLITVQQQLGPMFGTGIRLTLTLAAGAGILFVFKSMLSFLLVLRSYRFLANRQAMVSSRLASRLLARSMLEIQARPSQETAFALTVGVNSATLGVLGGSVVVAAELAVLSVVAVGLLYLDPTVAVSTIAFFAVVALVLSKILGARARRLGEESSETEIAGLRSVQNILRTFREVSASGRKGLALAEFRELRWRAAQVQAQAQIVGQVTKYVFEVALVIGAAALALSQFRTEDPTAAIAVVAVFLVAASRAMPSLLRLQQAVVSIKAASGVASLTFELDDEPWLGEWGVEVNDYNRTRGMVRGILAGHPGFSPDIEVSRVSIRYPSSPHDALKEVSLSLRAGQSLALVGPTGAGKSTLADLILGILPPDTGSVTIGGLDPSEASRIWPGGLAYVPQDIMVVEGTVRQNVCLTLPARAVGDDLVWEALERSSLADFLRSHRDGLDTVVGENGVRLSGGQRQRLGLARALLSRPRLLVMDEATSALDAETELNVSTALRDLEGEVTIVVIAHRLATVRHCTTVAYLEAGKVTAVGDFQAVRSMEPRFDQQARLLGL